MIDLKPTLLLSNDYASLRHYSGYLAFNLSKTKISVIIVIKLLLIHHSDNNSTVNGMTRSSMQTIYYIRQCTED